MTQNKFISFSVAAIIILIGALVFLSINTSPAQPLSELSEATTNSTEASTSPAITSLVTSQYRPPTQSSLSLANAGRVVFAITDKTAELETIRSLFVTITKAQIFETKQGWITVPGSSKKFDLLELKNSNDLGYLGELLLTQNTYTKMALSISEVSVAFNDGTTGTVKIPSNTLIFIRPFDIKKGETYSVTFDILADKSLYQTNTGELLLLPVIKMSTGVYVRATILPNNKVRLSGSIGGTAATIGMNENGDIIENFMLLPTTVISYTGSVITLHPYDVDEARVSINAERALTIATGGGYIDQALSLWLKRQDTLYYWSIAALKGTSRITVDIDAMNGQIIQR